MKTDTGDDTGEINQCSGITYGPRMLKLLTRAGYQNSIEDLVGIDFNVSNSIPFDGLIKGCFNSADYERYGDGPISGILR